MVIDLGKSRKTTYKCRPQNGGFGRSKRIRPFAPKQALFHHKKTKQIFFVYANPFSSVPFDVIVFDQHLQERISIKNRCILDCHAKIHFAIETFVKQWLTIKISSKVLEKKIKFYEEVLKMFNFNASGRFEWATLNVKNYDCLQKKKVMKPNKGGPF